MIQIQLKNLKSLLDGEVSHQTLVDHTGKVSYRYTITYQETDGSTPYTSHIVCWVSRENHSRKCGMDR